MSLNESDDDTDNSGLVTTDSQSDVMQVIEESFTELKHINNVNIRGYTGDRVTQGNLKNLSAIIPCTINKIASSALLDTGAEVSLMSFDLYKQLPIKPPLSEQLKMEGIVKDTNISGWLAKGVEVSFRDDQVYTWNFYVASIPPLPLFLLGLILCAISKLLLILTGMCLI